jgi:hypothetical protein
MRLPSCAYLLYHLILQALANTEKAIFSAPSAVASSSDLVSLCLPILTPGQPVLHTQLPVAALDGRQADERAKHSWYLLNQLHTGQRYEARVCWAATVRRTYRTQIMSRTDTNPVIFGSNRPSSGLTRSLFRRFLRRRSLYLRLLNILTRGNGRHVVI